jgi:MYXO-CTERM domain-containing protein
MMTVRDWLRRSALSALALCVLLVSSSALGAGRVEWKSKTLKESDSKSWTIELSIFLSRAPDMATLPMRFSFMPVVYYERALVDGRDGPQIRQVPLQGKPPLVESVDVGFLDPGTGQIQKRTKFSFKVTRGHGYEAGEYDVTIKDGRTDATIGQTTRLIFDGENEVIDRRAMVFGGEKKKKPKDGEGEGEDGEGKSEDAPKKKELTEDDPGFWAGGPKDDPDTSDQEVEPKRGCGCRIEATSGLSDALGTALLGLALGAVMLRRRGGQSAP